MSATPKTIQIFLPGGDPRGIRVAEITTRIVQVIEVPRSLLQDFLSMPESKQVALYFLFGEDQNSGENKVYIGQTGDLQARLNSHNRTKEFWQRALVLISRTNSLTQTHALFLEWFCIQAANKAGRYTVENGNAGSKPHTPAPLEADCMEIFETGQTLLATLGFPLFDAVAKGNVGRQGEETYYCEASGAKGKGLYTEEGFVVLKGSIGRKEIARSSRDTGLDRRRQQMYADGSLKVEGDRVEFDRDYLCTSPSMASDLVLGRSSNGWTEWKTKDGKTLDEVKRQSAE